ncbi:hypothetical protein HUJ05_001106 [Dendroctonus ponderosae]|nr:hypothetical protein HUJ05_001106 [Dendroctonus ponderosae]
MSDSKSKKVFAVMRIILMCAGFWNQSISKNRLINKIFHGYSVFVKLSCLVFWLLILAETSRLIICQYEITIITASVAILLTDTKIVVKIVIFLKHNILDIVADVIENKDEIRTEHYKEIKMLYDRKANFLKFAISVLGGSTTGAVFLLQGSGGALVLQDRKHNKLFNDTVETHGMYQTIFPLHRNNHIYWLFATEVFWSYLGITANIVTQLICVIILLHAASRLEVLQVRFKHLIMPDFQIKASDEDMKAKVTELKSIIRKYQLTIRFINEFNQSTKYITMIEFCLSTFDMASCCASLTKMKGYESVWLLFFMMVLLTQLYLIGWTANEIRSEAIATALYESNWYELNKEGRQLILISMIRAQRPLNINIGPMGPMTTRSILTVLKGAYSYINIMR